jgi:hypothetical protein
MKVALGNDNDGDNVADKEGMNEWGDGTGDIARRANRERDDNVRCGLKTVTLLRATEGKRVRAE